MAKAYFSFPQSSTRRLIRKTKIGFGEKAPYAPSPFKNLRFYSV